MSSGAGRLQVSEGFRTFMRFPMLALVMAVSTVAQADPVLPAATFSGTGGANGNPIYPALIAPGTGTASFIGTTGSASVTVILSGSPSASIGVTDSASNAVVEGDGQIIYYLEVTGGSGIPTPVTLDVSAFASTTGSADGGAGITFAIGQGGSFIQTWRACASGVPTASCSVFPTSFNLVNTPVTVLSNTLTEVLLAAGGGVATQTITGMQEPGTGAMEAFIDPALHVDPSTPNASQYSLAFSPGIGNSVVPEPSALAFVALALVGVALVKRRNRIWRWRLCTKTNDPTARRRQL